jgi:hypothetical protein
MAQQLGPLCGFFQKCSWATTWAITQTVVVPLSDHDLGHGHVANPPLSQNITHSKQVYIKS